MPVLKIPYPPSPPDIPAGLTDYADSFTRKQNLLLASLFVFLIFYIAMIIFFAMVGTWCFLTLAKWPVVKIIGVVLCGTFLLYLVKGFFKRPAVNKEMHIEITEEEQPVLFGFIDQLCEELDAPEPNKVFVSPDVNAGVLSRTSLVNLFVEPKRDLIIGLGLVNCTNLSEFKAVLAHEFGHFCHLGPTSNYTIVVKRIIFDLVEGEDWFDRLVIWSKRQENVFSAFGYAVGGCLWLPRMVLWWILKTITLQDRAVSREQEFHADLVAVSAAGSDASAHGLLRVHFGLHCFYQAVRDLVTAIDHKLYSNDLYLHQDRAAAVVRRQKKQLDLGLPPDLAHPTAGKEVRVFDSEEEELEDDDTPPMWRTHPSNADREENAKRDFVPAVVDHRSPWILFNEVPELKERLTYKFYRMELRIPKNADLVDAVKVQEYIDNEHAETTYDPKYHGAYDERILEPGVLEELDSILRESPWTDDRMEKVYEKIFDGCREHAEVHSDLHKELESLNSKVVGKPSPRVKRMIKDIEAKLEDNREWFKSFDRRVYLLHVQMAKVNREWRQELIERYRFQMAVQRYYKDARESYNKADLYMTVLFNSNPNELPPDFPAEVMQVLRESWKALRKIVREAKEINLPAMKNFDEGERLADFILPEKMVPEPPLDYAKGIWIDKLMRQLEGVRLRCFRLHFKSVGGILALQEKIAAAWVAAREPVCAEIVEEAPIEAIAVDTEPVDALPADFMAAEVIPAEVAVESFIDALPVESESTALAVSEAVATLVAPQPQQEPVPPAAEEPAFKLPGNEPEPEPAQVEPDPEATFDLDRILAADPSPGVGEVVTKPQPEPETTMPEKPEKARPSEEVFSLDADDAEKAEVFSLDAEPPAVEAAEIFSLDADEHASAEAPTTEKKPGPAARPAFGSGTSATMPALSGNGRRIRKRPVVKITIVKPGEKSPFG